ncbi:MAG: hypothetical protein RPR97_14285 [Colwellia sp.]|jgi:hypothetical protein
MKNTQNNAVEIELSKNGTNLYIFFGGIAAGINMPPFEFYSSAKIINENKIFIRDFSQSWYQNGLSKISQDIDSTVNFLKLQIKNIKPHKIFFVGNSMGGYAAIMFSHLIGKGEAIAFAPQTFISPMLRFKHQDSRWREEVYKTYIRSFFKRKIWDLKRLLRNTNTNQKISIFVSNNEHLDYVHATHIKGIDGVNIFDFGSGGHGVVKLLRDEGKLPAIMAGTYIHSN